MYVCIVICMLCTVGPCVIASSLQIAVRGQPVIAITPLPHRLAIACVILAILAVVHHHRHRPTTHVYPCCHTGWHASVLPCRRHWDHCRTGWHALRLSPLRHHHCCRTVLTRVSIPRPPLLSSSLSSTTLCHHGTGHARHLVVVVIGFDIAPTGTHVCPPFVGIVVNDVVPP